MVSFLCGTYSTIKMMHGPINIRFYKHHYVEVFRSTEFTLIGQEIWDVWVEDKYVSLVEWW
jgi:hypothetical protein